MESQKQRCFQFARAAIAKSHDLDGSHNKNELSQFCAVLHVVAQLCLTLCDPVDYAHQAPLSMGILQARILEWIAMPPSRGSSQPRDRTHVSHIAGRFFTLLITREAQSIC